MSETPNNWRAADEFDFPESVPGVPPRDGGAKPAEDFEALRAEAARMAREVGIVTGDQPGASEPGRKVRDIDAKELFARYAPEQGQAVEVRIDGWADLLTRLDAIKSAVDANTNVLRLVAEGR